MSDYEKDIRDRVVQILSDNLSWVDLHLNPSTVDWLASCVYDELEDELRGPA